MMNLSQLIKICKQEANKSILHYKVGAIVLNKKGKIVSSTCNIKKTHPLQAKLAARAGFFKKIYLHAELRSIIHARGEGHTLMVVRVNEKGKLAMAKPCAICRMAVEETDIKHIYYSNEKGNIEYESLCYT